MGERSTAAPGNSYQWCDDHACYHDVELSPCNHHRPSNWEAGDLLRSPGIKILDGPYNDRWRKKYESALQEAKRDAEATADIT